MAKIGKSEVSPEVLLIGGAVLVAGLAIYEFLKPSSSNVAPAQSGQATTNPQNTSNPQSNPQLYYMPSVAPSNSQSASVGSGSYYAINYSPTSTYAPFNYNYSSSNTSTNNTNLSYQQKQQTYTASGFGSSVYGQGSQTKTNQPFSSGLLGFLSGASNG
jgi:hypothetical protein